MSTTEQGMTHDELMTLPVAIPLETANRALHLGRTTGYHLARTGRYPVRVLRHGRAYKVSRYDLHRHLGVVAEQEARADSSAG
ncbi:integrase [Streptomyces sp. NPDC001941]|uniref:integrase n=1 Tax=Streptomyces sp. NPDC001941 TaxID=3154659 RepID=UPI003321CD35